REMDRLFETVTPALAPALAPAMAGATGLAPRVPPMNVWDDDQNVYAEVELPGVRLEDIQVEATSDSLSLRARRTVEPPEGATVIRSERASMQFERTLRLPVEIDPANVEATFREGVLRVVLPKAEHARPRRIEVKAALPRPS